MRGWREGQWGEVKGKGGGSQLNGQRQASTVIDTVKRAQTDSYILNHISVGGEGMCGKDTAKGYVEEGGWMFGIGLHT